MPRTRSLAWSELRIGVLTIVAIVIAAVLIFSLTGTRGFFWQRYQLKTKFGDAGAAQLKELKDLKSLEAVNTDLTEKGAMALEAAIPGVRVRR